MTECTTTEAVEREATCRRPHVELNATSLPDGSAHDAHLDPPQKELTSVPRVHTTCFLIHRLASDTECAQGFGSLPVRQLAPDQRRTRSAAAHLARSGLDDRAGPEMGSRGRREGQTGAHRCKHVPIYETWIEPLES